jgi:hypothetical protein
LRPDDREETLPLILLLSGLFFSGPYLFFQLANFAQTAAIRLEQTIREKKYGPCG